METGWSLPLPPCLRSIRIDPSSAEQGASFQVYSVSIFIVLPHRSIACKDSKADFAELVVQ